MFLSRIALDPRCNEARRDLSDPYQLHSTLCRAFTKTDAKCQQGTFLWRMEPETDAQDHPLVLVQSRSVPDWSAVGIAGWLAKATEPIDLKKRLRLDGLKKGVNFRFRLRANPSVTRNGKRQGLLRLEEQEQWLIRKGNLHGFSVPRLISFDLDDSALERVDVRVSQERLLVGKKRTGDPIRVYSVLFDGFLSVTAPDLFAKAIESGVGHGKAMGLGLFSVAPVA